VAFCRVRFTPAAAPGLGEDEQDAEQGALTPAPESALPRRERSVYPGVDAPRTSTEPPLEARTARGQPGSALDTWTKEKIDGAERVWRQQPGWLLGVVHYECLRYAHDSDAFREVAKEFLPELDAEDVEALRVFAWAKNVGGCRHNGAGPTEMEEDA
jgi:hypothetical protein